MHDCQRLMTSSAPSARERVRRWSSDRVSVLLFRLLGVLFQDGIGEVLEVRQVGELTDAREGEEAAALRERASVEE